jgi:UDP-glucose 4-epimerase
MRCIALRPYSVYGPGQDLSTGYIGQLLEAWTAGTPVALSGNPAFVRDFVHIDDVVDACLASAVQDQPFDVVNVGSGTATSLGALLELFTSLSGAELNVSFKPARRGTIERMLADLKRQTAVLNRNPIQLALGLRSTMEAHCPGKLPIA